MDQTPTSSSPEPTQPAAASTDNWQARFTGLQQTIARTLNTLGYQGLDAIPAAADVASWRQAAEQLPSLQKELEKIQAELDATRAQAQQAQASELRYRLVAQEAPDLFHLADYVPAHADPDQVRAAIRDLRDRLNRLGRPASPPPSGQTGQGADTTIQDKIAAYNDALRRNDLKAAERLGVEIAELQAKRMKR